MAILRTLETTMWRAGSMEKNRLRIRFSLGQDYFLAAKAPKSPRLQLNASIGSILAYNYEVAI